MPKRMISWNNHIMKRFNQVTNSTDLRYEFKMRVRELDTKHFMFGRKWIPSNKL